MVAGLCHVGAMKEAVVRARVASGLKRDAEAVFAQLGINTTEAIRMFLRQVRYGEACRSRFQSRTIRTCCYRLPCGSARWMPCMTTKPGEVYRVDLGLGGQGPLDGGRLAGRR